MERESERSDPASELVAMEFISHWPTKALTEDFRFGEKSAKVGERIIIFGGASSEDMLFEPNKNEHDCFFLMGVVQVCLDSTLFYFSLIKHRISTDHPTFSQLSTPNSYIQQN